jgi:glycosyltransferase involved in cell wall biosynthesis
VKILHFFKTYLPVTVGGIENVIYQLCMGHTEQGHQTTVLTIAKDPTPQAVQVGNHWVYRARETLDVASTPASIESISLFRRLAQDADLIHYHYPWPFMDLVHLLICPDKPTVVTYHSDIVKQKYLIHLYRPLMNRFFGKVDAIVATSPNYLETSEVLQAYRDKVTMITYGLDRDSYPTASEQEKAQVFERFGPTFFLFVGVLRYYKGLEHLIDAAAGLPWPIVIAGSGPMESELKAQAKRLGLTNLHFLGRITDTEKAALLAQCSAVVFPSHLRAEAFGITLLEGAMYGKPLVSCEIGTGTSFINRHQETGLVVPPGNPLALREALRELAENADLAFAMGSRAHERFEACFQARMMCQNYLNLYERVIKNH